MKLILFLIIVFGVSLQNCEGRQKRMGTFEKRLMKFEGDPEVLMIGDGLYTRDIRGGIDGYQVIMKPANEKRASWRLDYTY